MKTKLIIASILSVFLFGCSGDPYEKYLGYWKNNDERHSKVLQISKDGDSYLFNDNIFQETDFAGNKKKSVVLKTSESQLSVENGFGSIILGLSGDSRTLRAANMEYTKISESEFQAIKAEIEVEEKQREKNKELCNTLNTEYKSATGKLDSSALGYIEKSKNKSEVVTTFKEKAKEIPNCNVGLFW